MTERYEIDPATGCWNWLGSIGSHGYGQMWNGFGPELVHRIFYKKNKGPIPEGHHVLHKCDNTRCINPDHLYAGTAKNNADDREFRERGNHAKGERNALAKLTEEDICLIRKLAESESQRALGRRFKVAHTTIGAVIRGKAWVHVE